MPGRVLDEKIALQNGVLGQETTGPGGFAMALRSIPAILKYAELLEKIQPGRLDVKFHQSFRAGHPGFV